MGGRGAGEQITLRGVNRPCLAAGWSWQAFGLQTACCWCGQGGWGWLGWGGVQLGGCEPVSLQHCCAACTVTNCTQYPDKIVGQNICQDWYACLHSNTSFHNNSVMQHATADCQPETRGAALQDTGLPVDWASSTDSKHSACRCCLALARAWRLPFRTLPLLIPLYLGDLHLLPVPLLLLFVSPAFPRHL